MSKITSYNHLLSSVAAVKAKEVDGDKDAEPVAPQSPPKNDKPDGKKAKKADKSEEREEKDEEEGESEEKKEDKEESEEKENEDKEDKKGKKSKKASASLSADEAQAVRLEERVRCATIFQSKASAGKPDLAARFAFHTNLSAEEAILLMEGFAPVEQQAPKRASLDDRMASVKSPNVGSDSLQANVHAPVANGLTEADLAKLDAKSKALMILNSTRQASGEALLTKLPN